MGESMRHLGRVAKYGLLPGVFPRIRELFGSGFSCFTFFMANVYKGVGLLPAGHPYLNPHNRGRFGIWNVMAEARRNLVFSPAHIDQILVFFCLWVGIALLVMQFGLLLLSVFVQSAWAGVGAWWARFFVTANPEEDLAFVTLDRIFGVPDIFNSRIAGGDDGAFPSAFHVGLHELFSYYSIGIFAVAIIIIIYYAITLTAETAQSGQPFGRRFNSWAPARLILCIALLAPISNGMNIAQLGTLRVAKWGSSMATNGWIEFNNAVEDGQTQLGLRENLIAIPNRPSMNTFHEWTVLAKVCQFMHQYMYNRTVVPYVVRTAPENAGGATVGPDFALFLGTDYATARTISANGTITIVMGEQNDAYTRDRWNIRPFCGVIAIEMADVENEGVIDLQEAYFNILQDDMGYGGSETSNILTEAAIGIAQRFVPTPNKNPEAVVNLSMENIAAVRRDTMQRIQAAIDAARTTVQAEADWDTFEERYGWAGAGIWYNKVAQYNGTFFEAVYNLPVPIRYPEVMEWVRERRSEQEEQVHARDRYRPYRLGGDVENPLGMVEFKDQGELYIAQALHYVQTMWAGAYVKSDDSAILDYVQLVFGAAGLFNMRRNIEAGVHPLAALVGIGSAMIQSTVINIGAGALGGALGGIGYMTGSDVIKSLGAAISKVSFQIALLGISTGFILYYVLPFLPFLYFTFAFGGWLKAVFEAMVGLPLWALAHLKIDGEGINGPMALDGFFLVFEIFVRPIVIVIALISSVATFSAMTIATNATWDVVLDNLTGHKPNLGAYLPLPPGVPPQGGTWYRATTGSGQGLRGIVDYLFFTVLYAIFIYIIALSCFKMIDLVPNYVLRWMGKGIRTIGEGELSEDPGQSLLRNVSIGSSAVVDKFSGSSISMMKALVGGK